MNTQPPRDDDRDLIDRYREAVDLSGPSGERPSDRVRATILAQAAAQMQQDSSRPAADPRRPAANEGRWRLRALASAATFGLVGLLAWQVQHGPDEPTDTTAAMVVERADPPSPSPSASTRSAEVAEASPPSTSFATDPPAPADAAPQAAARARAAPAPMAAEATAASPGDATRRLWQAASAGDVEALRRALADGADVNARDAQGRTALQRAVAAPNVPADQVADTVRALLTAGADAAPIDSTGGR
jgi:cytoskeletal protein RodZ